MIVNVWCPILNGECRHCSKEGVRRKTRACLLNGRGEVYVTQEVIFGLYCSNYCDWIPKVQDCHIAQKSGRNVPASSTVWNRIEQGAGQQKLVV